MKIFAILLLVCGGLFLGLHASAATYVGIGTVNCTFVNTRAEADSTHVYTLNPAYTYQLNGEYRNFWAREARCSELQFHVDHNTTIPRLDAWLKSTAIGWYKNMASSPYNNQTVSTLRYEWFLVKDGQLRRIPDILTGWSWGLMAGDRMSIPYTMTNDFYASVKIGAPLKFTDGVYASEILAVWKDGKRDYSALPSVMAAEIDKAVNNTFAGEMEDGIFEACVFGNRYPGDSWGKLFDWSWMKRNPGCNVV